MPLSNTLNIIPNKRNRNLLNYTKLLDVFGGATVAYSFRKLRQNYSGPCLRVRRSSDNAELVLGFVGDFLDIASLISFVGSSSAFVVRWYDQSGNAIDVAQAVSTSQARIVNAGVIDRVGSNYGVKFTPNNVMASGAISNRLRLQTNDGSVSVFSVFGTSYQAGSTYSLFSATGQNLGIANRLSADTPQNGGNTIFYSSYLGSTVSATNLLWENLNIGSFLRNVNNASIRQNRVQKANSNFNAILVDDTFNLRLSSIGNNHYLNGYISEFILYPFYQSNFDSIEGSQSLFYNL